MPFNSLKFMAFLPLVYLAFYLVGDRARWCVLLGASFCFYAALKVPYLPAVLLLVALASYGFGIWIERAQAPGAKRALLWAGIAVNAGILIALKYLPFLSEILGALSPLVAPGAQVQPVRAYVAIGVSYYVFQAMSYLFDIYLEMEKAERHFGYFALYLAFFPKLLQGPIERAGHLIPQLKAGYRFDYDNMRFGMLLFAWGLFKKVVLADRLGLYVDPVYNDLHAYSGLTLILATYAYAFQIYLDFSGYTDMALGCAKLFNISLTRNFDSPYLATSVADFWRRWHISFSRWILDYVFKPLQLQWRDWKNWGTAAALILAFLVSGIWHGASWGFVIWGGLHGLYLASSVFYKPYQKKLHKALGVEKTRLLRAWQVVVTFNLVSLAWVFFRAASLADAVYVLKNMFTGVRDVGKFLALPGTFNLLALALAALALVTVANGYPRYRASFLERTAFRWTLYYSLLTAIVVLGTFGSSSFMYFKF